MSVGEFWSDVDILALLLEAGANPNAYRNGCVEDRRTVLEEAVMYGKAAVVKLLLDAGADPTVSCASNMASEPFDGKKLRVETVTSHPYTGPDGREYRVGFQDQEKGRLASGRYLVDKTGRPHFFLPPRPLTDLLGQGSPRIRKMLATAAARRSL